MSSFSENFEDKVDPKRATASLTYYGIFADLFLICLTVRARLLCVFVVQRRVCV